MNIYIWITLSIYAIFIIGYNTYAVKEKKNKFFIVMLSSAIAFFIAIPMFIFGLGRMAAEWATKKNGG